MKKHLALTGFRSGRETTVGSLTGNLAELIRAMRADGRTLVTLAEFSDLRYIQIIVHPNGDVIGEVLSNLNIHDAIALQPWAEEHLRAIGFTAPAYGPNPNWWYLAANDASCITLVSLLHRAIIEVLEEVPTNTVMVRTWDVAIPPGWSHDAIRTELRAHVRDDALDPGTE